MDRNKFINSYIEESAEHVRSIENGIISLREDPENTLLLDSILRSLHSLKGASRMLDFSVIEALSHELESVCKAIKEERCPIDEKTVQLFFHSTRLLDETLATVKASGADTVKCDSTLDLLKRVHTGKDWDLEMLSGESGSKDTPSASLAFQNEQPASPGALGASSIRISTSQIEQLIEDMQSLIVRQFQLKKACEIVSSCRQDQGSHTTDAQTPKDICKAIDIFRSAAKEHFSIIERTSFSLLEDAYELRMLPLTLVMGTLPRMVEETAITLGKKVKLSVTGSETGLDKSVLEHLKDPLIHIVRNAVDHGLETPEERKAAGKPETGLISIHCSNPGQHIRIVVEDDGRGLDYEKIRARAMEQYPDDSAAIAHQDNEALISWLFLPGFSTRKETSSLSGRGVGLDIVKQNLETIKGRATIHSENGNGTSIEILLPLSLATISGFFAKISGMHCFLPGDYIEEIVLMKHTALIPLHNMEGIRFRSRVIPRYRLSWIVKAAGYEDEPDTAALIISLFGESAALTVEWIDDYSARILKPMPDCLQRIESMQGFVFNDSFEMIPVLSIPVLLQHLKGLRDIDRYQRSFASRKWYQQILLAEDSQSTREVIQAALENNGYKVDTAEDGIEALKLIRRKKYALILSDVEMPRMDGITFLENLRREPDYAETPFIIISNHEEQEMLQNARHAGADSIILKSDFNRNRLLETIHSFIGPAERNYDN